MSSSTLLHLLSTKSSTGKAGAFLSLSTPTLYVKGFCLLS